MPNETARNLSGATGLEVYQSSLSQAGRVTYFLARRAEEKFVGSLGRGKITGRKVAELEGQEVIVGPTDHANAQAVRSALPWSGPRRIGLAGSIGFGDRLGLAGPGHIQAVRGTGLTPVLAQQSIREMTRTQRSPDEVMDAATWAVLQEGYGDGFGSDADHLQSFDDIDITAAAGFTMFTIDPGSHVDNEADGLEPAALAEKFATLDFEALQATPGELKGLYAGKSFPLEGGGEVRFDESTFLRSAVKYGSAIAHTVRMYQHLIATATDDFELEVSVDETESPTSPAEHYFFAAELKRLGVEWVSMAPRFVGRFEKGVDYIGDLDAFRHSFAEHVAVMRTLGPYKISIHSGSDKFSIYPIIAELTGGLVHLKTAGTSYLEALHAIAGIDPALFREILTFALARYETDKATYHVSAEPGKAPAAGPLEDNELVALLDDFNARQVLHVTFGTVLTADGGARFRDRILSALRQQEQTHYALLREHLARHVEPFVRPAGGA